MQEFGIPSTSLDDLKRVSYLLEQAPQKYVVNRAKTEYERALPKFKGRSVVEHLNTKLLEDSSEVSILDIGCGEARFLGQLVEDCECLSETKLRLKAAGLTAADYRCYIQEPYWQDLVSKVDYRMGDAHCLTEIFPDQKFDFITSLYAFVYFVEPLRVLEQTYSLLKEGGIAFIHCSGINCNEEAMEELQQNWKENYGIDSDFSSAQSLGIANRIHLFNVAFRRNHIEHLSIPSKYK